MLPWWSPMLAIHARYNLPVVSKGQFMLFIFSIGPPYESKLIATPFPLIRLLRAYKYFFNNTGTWRLFAIKSMSWLERRLAEVDSKGDDKYWVRSSCMPPGASTYNVSWCKVIIMEICFHPRAKPGVWFWFLFSTCTLILGIQYDFLPFAWYMSGGFYWLFASVVVLIIAGTYSMFMFSLWYSK